MAYFSEVECLRREARRLYKVYMEELGRYDCGATLAEHVNPRLLEAKLNFNATLDKLATLDPACPTRRL